MMDQYNALNADQRSADVGSQESSNLPPSNVITPRGSILGNLPKNDIKPSDVEAAPIEKKYPIIQITSVTKGIFQYFLKNKLNICPLRCRKKHDQQINITYYPFPLF